MGVGPQESARHSTDLNGNSGPQTIEEGAAEIVRVALLNPPVTGKFLETGGEVLFQEPEASTSAAFPFPRSLKTQ